MLLPLARVRLRRVALVAALAALGCDDRRSQCNRLIDAINPHHEAITRAVEALTDIERTPAVADGLAGTVREADQALAPIQLEDAELAGYLLAYRRQLGTAAEVADALVRAAPTAEPAALHEAVTRADAVVARQDAILRRVNAYCQDLNEPE